MTEAENDMLAHIELGRVDDELRLTRIRLMRALNQENERGDTAELEARVEREGAGEYQAKTEEKFKVRDYAGLIDRLTGRIESLERTRAELLKTNPVELPPVTRIEIEVVGGRKDAAGANDAASG
jgi:hypothetical protein